MSFSSDVKIEVAGIYPSANHCRSSELAAIMMMCAKVMYTEKSGYSIRLVTENQLISDKFQELLGLAFKISGRVFVKMNSSSHVGGSYTVMIDDSVAALEILKATHLLERFHKDGELIPGEELFYDNCCKRAFIRGVFLAAGSISNPERFYHLEIVCTLEEKAAFISKVMESFDIDAKVVIRKKYHVVYIKEGEQIVDVLNVCEAHRSLFEFEDIRVLKEVRNSVNRKVNCEAANINRTVAAALKQVEDIEYIRQTKGLDILTDSLKELAELRLENSEISLKELGEMLYPPVGKSGVNHRLRKISEIADDIREGKFNG